MDLNTFNAGFYCQPNTFTNLLEKKVESITSDSVYPCTDNIIKKLSAGNRNTSCRCVDKNVGSNSLGNSYLADIKQFSTEYVEDSNFFNSGILQSPSCDKSVGVSEKLAEWIRCKLSQTKSLPENNAE